MAQAPSSYLERVRPRWVPGEIPEGEEGIRALKMELDKLAEYLQAPVLDAIQFPLLYAAPVKPRDGMLCYFAANIVGTQEGLYQFRTGQWRRIN